MKGACTRRTCHSKWLKNVDDINLMHELAGKQIVNRNSCYGNAIYRTAHSRTHTQTYLYLWRLCKTKKDCLLFFELYSYSISIRCAWNYKMKKVLQHFMVNYLWIKFVSLLSTDVTSAPEFPLSLVFWLVAQWAPHSTSSCLQLCGWFETCAKYKIAMHKIWQFIDALLLLLLLRAHDLQDSATESTQI